MSVVELPRDWTKEKPTAQALVAERATTPLSGLCVDEGWGLVTRLQLVPSQCSVSDTFPEEVPANPTAQTSLADDAATALNWLPPLIVKTKLQLVPSQCSIIPCSEVGVVKAPT